MIKGLVSALRLLSSLPLPGKWYAPSSAALSWFPPAGLILGLIIFILYLFWSWLPFDMSWPRGTALIMLLADVYLTRAFHMDGLADWADSFGALGDVQRRLAIMKDTALGTFGVIALILILLAKWIVFERLCVFGTVIWILPVFVLSRAVMVELAVALPYARKEGGTGEPFVMEASRTHRRNSRLFCLVFCFLYGPGGLILLLMALIFAWVYGVKAKQHFGGITGDLLGAANELTEIILLLMCALPGSVLNGYTAWNWLFN